MHINQQDAAVAVVRFLGAVPVVSIEVHDGNALYLVRAVSIIC